MTEIATIGVIGTGLMGSGIAHVGSRAGYQILIHDIDPEAVRKARETIAKNLSREVKKQKLTEAERESTLERIVTAESLAAFAKADLVIEAVTENLELKLKFYEDLGQFLRPETLVASNTSSFSITRLATATPDPARFMGVHFFNPAPIMPLVELIPGLATHQETYTTLQGVVEQMGKAPVKTKDSPGFIVNRILCPMLNEAIVSLQEGVGSVEDIDKAMLLGARHPMGPLTLADYIGLDTLLAIMQELHRSLGEDKYRPCPILSKFVEAGWLGVKTGRGFYDYSQAPPAPTL